MHRDLSSKPDSWKPKISTSLKRQIDVNRREHLNLNVSSSIKGSIVCKRVSFEWDKRRFFSSRKTSLNCYSFDTVLERILRRLTLSSKIIWRFPQFVKKSCSYSAFLVALWHPNCLQYCKAACLWLWRQPPSMYFGKNHNKEEEKRDCHGRITMSWLFVLGKYSILATAYEYSSLFSVKVIFKLYF